LDVGDLSIRVGCPVWHHKREMRSAGFRKNHSNRKSNFIIHKSNLMDARMTKERVMANTNAKRG
jgi:hypothetical protein